MNLLLYLTMAIITANPIEAEDTMRHEADTFLSSLPEGLQHRQADAVRVACTGQTEPLQAVRDSRNVYASIPDYIEAFTLEGLGRMYRPASSGGPKMPLLVYLHGGGWCFGSVESCAAFCIDLASERQMSVLALDYPLAPEHPWPAALDFITGAMDYVYSHAADWGIDPGRISIGGDSSGGNLALCTALARQGDGGSRGTLASLVLFYPVTKAWADGTESWCRYGEGYGLDSDLMEAFNSAYAPESVRRCDSLISPALACPAALGGLPRVLLINAGRDILASQGCELASQLEEAGVEVSHEVYPEAVHLFITVPGQPAARAAAVKSTASFLSR